MSFDRNPKPNFWKKKKKQPKPYKSKKKKLTIYSLINTNIFRAFHSTSLFIRTKKRKQTFGETSWKTDTYADLPLYKADPCLCSKLFILTLPSIGFDSKLLKKNVIQYLVLKF